MDRELSWDAVNHLRKHKRQWQKGLALWLLMFRHRRRGRR